METPLVSIIVPVYNEETYLVDCLESLLNQAYENIEVIVVFDKGSTDNSLQILRNFESHRRLKVIEIDHTNIARALNLGVEQANGELFIYVEADSKLRTNYVQRGVEAYQLERRPAVAGIAIFNEYWGVSGIWGKCHSELSKIRDNRYLKRDLQLDWCYFFRRNAVLRVGGFNEKLFISEDRELVRRLKQEGYTFLVVPEFLRSHAASGIINNPLATIKHVFRSGYLHSKQGGKVNPFPKKHALFYGSVLASVFGFLLFPSKYAALLTIIVLTIGYLVKFSTVVWHGWDVVENRAYLFLLPIFLIIRGFPYLLGYIKGLLEGM